MQYNQIRSETSGDRSGGAEPAALVTGASRGIGLALARVLARHGHDLVLTARSEGELEAVAGELTRAFGVRVRVIPGDLADPRTPIRLARTLASAGVEVDILINNAGFGSRGAFHESDPSAHLEVLRVNVEALTHLTALFLPGMVERRRGRILQVASTAAFQPGPRMAVYYASKAYVLHLSEAVAEEVAGSGVTITVLCPGPVPTGFQARARMENAALVRGLIPKSRPDSVALAGYRGMMGGRRLVVPGLLNRLGAFGVRLLPRTVAAKLAGRLNRDV